MTALYLLMVLWPGTADFQPYAGPFAVEADCDKVKARVARHFDHVMVWEHPKLECKLVDGEMK